MYNKNKGLQNYILWKKLKLEFAFCGLTANSIQAVTGDRSIV
jgi:hypothetical protein